MANNLRLFLEHTLRDYSNQSLEDFEKQIYEMLFNDIKDKEEGAAMKLLLHNYLPKLHEGIKKAYKSGQARVIPSLSILDDQLLLTPLHLQHLDDFEKLPSSLPVHLLKYAPMSNSRKMRCHQEWQMYLTLARKYPMQKDTKAGVWWLQKTIAEKLPSLSYVAHGCLCLSVSAANVERSHKALNRILPNDHSRDTLKDENVECESFCVVNKSLLNLFRGAKPVEMIQE